MEIRKREIEIIELCGKARSGKDTIMNYLKNMFFEKGKSVINLQFSSTIKEYAKNVTDWNGDDDNKPRELLQILGTDIIREKIDEDFFIKRMIQDIKVYSYFFDIIIISDVRFIREIELIRDIFKDVISINVVRPNNDNNLSNKQKKHKTEIGLDGYDKFDYEIINDGTLKELEEKVRNIFLKIVK